MTEKPQKRQKHKRQQTKWKNTRIKKLIKTKGKSKLLAETALKTNY